MRTIVCFRMLLAAAPALGFASTLLADDQKAPGKPSDVKNTFRNICAFCHADYGRKAGKGPQLMNSERSDDFMFTRIKNGIPGRMAAFGTSFGDDDIRLIVKFIRSLTGRRAAESAMTFLPELLRAFCERPGCSGMQ